MAQQETAQYAQQAGAAKQARMDAITGGIKGAAGMVAGFGDAEAQKWGATDISGVTEADSGDEFKQFQEWQEFQKMQNQGG